MKKLFLILNLTLGLLLSSTLLSPKIFANTITSDNFFDSMEEQYSGQDFIEVKVPNSNCVDGYMKMFCTFTMPSGAPLPFGFLKLNDVQLGIIGSDLTSVSSIKTLEYHYCCDDGNSVFLSSSQFSNLSSSLDYITFENSFTLIKSSIPLYIRDGSTGVINIGGGIPPNDYPDDGVNISRFWSNEYLDDFNVSPNTTSVYGLNISANIPDYIGFGKFIEYSIMVNGKTYKTGHLSDLLEIDLKDYVVGDRIIIPLSADVRFPVKAFVGTEPSKVLFTVQEYSIANILTSYIPFWNHTPVYTATDVLFIKPTLDGDIQTIIDVPVVDSDNNKLGFDSNIPKASDYDDSILGSIHYGFDKLLYYVEQPFKLIGSSVSSLIKSISNSFNWISTFNGFLANIFSFLPSEFLALIYVVVSAFALGIVLHIFLGR